MFKRLQIMPGLLLWLLSEVAIATPFSHSWYVAADAGVFQGAFDSQYLDQSDVISQNTVQTLFQHGYTAGLRVGYSKLFYNTYLLGAELSGAYHSGNARFANGAATLAFYDKIYINNHVDLAIIPGLLITETFAIYGRLGIAYVSLTDHVTSPAGFAPVNTRVSSADHTYGGVLGLGLKKFISDNFAVYAEYDYHDYGTTNFPEFVNFTATYSHSAHVYTQDVLLGLSYSFL